MKLLLSITVLIVAVFAAPNLASADEPACAEGYVASGPYCVNPIYVNNPLFVDPATCEHGYYQGSCVPATLPEPVEHPADEYTFQPVAPVVAPVAVAAPRAQRPVCDPATQLCECRPELGCTPCLPELGCKRAPRWLSAPELGLGFTRSVR